MEHWLKSPRRFWPKGAVAPGHIQAGEIGGTTVEWPCDGCGCILIRFSGTLLREYLEANRETGFSGGVCPYCGRSFRITAKAVLARL